MAIDTLGGLFSLFALGQFSCCSARMTQEADSVLQRHKEPLISWAGSCTFLCKLSAVVLSCSGTDTIDNSVVLELGIYISHIIWRIRYRKLIREAKASGQSIDDLLDLEKSNTENTIELEKGTCVRPEDRAAGEPSESVDCII